MTTPMVEPGEVERELREAAERQIADDEAWVTHGKWNEDQRGRYIDPTHVLTILDALAEARRDAEDFAGQLAAYRESEAYFAAQAVMERENALTAQRDAAIRERDEARRTGRIAAGAFAKGLVSRTVLRAERDEWQRKSKLHEEHSERLTVKGAAVRAERDALAALLREAGETALSIHKTLAPGNRTFDELMRDAMLADDIARALRARIEAALANLPLQQNSTQPQNNP